MRSGPTTYYIIQENGETNSYYNIMARLPQMAYLYLPPGVTFTQSNLSSAFHLHKTIVSIGMGSVGVYTYSFVYRMSTDRRDDLNIMQPRNVVSKVHDEIQ
jgi:hypothetical protein